MDRREFLKILGVSGATTAVALAGCKRQEQQTTTSRELQPVPTDKMTYRSFPHLGKDKVSVLGFGCMRFPTKKEEDSDNQVIDQEAVNELIGYAMEHGVNYFDTSPVYCKGLSERVTGIALEKYPRESYYLATKLSNFSNYSREASMKMYRESFTEMQTDYIDYYMLHSLGGGGMKRYNERFVDNGMVPFLLDERKKGKIRHLGFSYHGDKETFDQLMTLHDEHVKAHGEHLWDFVMIQMNYVDWRTPQRRGLDAEYQYNELAKRSIAVAIMEPLLGGRLAKLPDHIVKRLKQRAPEGSVASWAFRFAASHDMVMTVNSGMKYLEHIQDNVRTLSPLTPLTDEEKEYLYETAELINKYPTVACTNCLYCMPCPYGIDIPSILLHYNKCVNEGSVPKDSQDPDYRRLRRRYLIGYDRAVPRLRQADHCIGCGICTELCPQRIDIPKQLRRIDDFIEQLKQDTL